MKRITTLGLAAIAALALTASIGASSASASAEFVSEVGSKESTTIKATPNANLEFALVGGVALKCEQYKWEGKFTGTHSLEASLASNEAVLHCEGQGAGGGWWGKTTFEPKSCNLTFAPAVFGGAGKLGIGPAGCGAMHIRSRQGEGECDYAFAPQTASVAPFTVTGTPSDVEVKASTYLHFTLEKGTKALCGSESMAVATGWLLSAWSGAGAQVNLAIAKTPLSFNSGAGLFEAGSYPLAISGGQDPANKYNLTIKGMPPMTCATVTFSGELAAAASQLPLQAAYAGCSITIGGVVKPTTVAMNSCHYALNAAGTVDLACSKEGDAVEISTYNGEGGALLCKWKMGQQLGLKSAAYSNVGAPNEQGVAVKLELGGIAVSRTSGSALACGVASNTATYTGGTTLSEP